MTSQPEPGLGGDQASAGETGQATGAPRNTTTVTSPISSFNLFQTPPGIITPTTATATSSLFVSPFTPSYRGYPFSITPQVNELQASFPFTTFLSPPLDTQRRTQSSITQLPYSGERGPETSDAPSQVFAGGSSAIPVSATPHQAHATPQNNER